MSNNQKYLPPGDLRNHIENLKAKNKNKLSTKGKAIYVEPPKTNVAEPLGPFTEKQCTSPIKIAQKDWCNEVLPDKSIFERLAPLCTSTPERKKAMFEEQKKGGSNAKRQDKKNVLVK